MILSRLKKIHKKEQAYKNSLNIWLQHKAHISPLPVIRIEIEIKSTHKKIFLMLLWFIWVILIFSAIMKIRNLLLFKKKKNNKKKLSYLHMTSELKFWTQHVMKLAIMRELTTLIRVCRRDAKLCRIRTGCIHLNVPFGGSLFYFSRCFF